MFFLSFRSLMGFPGCVRILSLEKNHSFIRKKFRMFYILERFTTSHEKCTNHAIATYRYPREKSCALKCNKIRICKFYEIKSPLCKFYSKCASQPSPTSTLYHKKGDALQRWCGDMDQMKNTYISLGNCDLFCPL